MSDITRPIEPFELTQDFGNNPIGSDGKPIYAQFGLKGHNGWDLRTKFDDTPLGRRNILASWFSEFYRKGDDPNGYGRFFETLIQLKSIWKLTLAHCWSIEDFKTKNESEIMAVSDNTGFSSGAHLHLTVKPIKIENGQHINLLQDNGYFGAVNPQEFFDELRIFKLQQNSSTDTIPVPKAQFGDFERVKAGWNKVREKLNTEDNEVVVLAEIDKLIKYEDSVIQKDKTIIDANTKIAELEKNLKGLADSNNNLVEENKSLGQQVEKQGETIEIQEINISGLKEDIEQLKQDVGRPLLTGWRRIILKILEKL